MINAKGFTLIEVLIVIGIVVILSVAAVLTLNPAELLRQSRDAGRLADINTVNRALALYVTDIPNGLMGQSQTIYVSLPDATATTTQGTNCSSLGLPSLPLNWNYHCAGPTNLRGTDGNGWIPVNFRQMSSPSLATLPIDPKNDPLSGLYYTYQKGSWELTAAMESSKYQLGGSSNILMKDGGKFDDLFETGNDLKLLPIDRIAIFLSTSTPLVSMLSPAPAATVSGTITISASATDTFGIASVQFMLDGGDIGTPITVPPYQMNWDTTQTSNGVHNVSAYAVNLASRIGNSAPVAVNVLNMSSSLPSLVQFTVTSNAPANTCSAQLNSAVISGNLLVFTVDTNSSTAMLGVADNRGNTWNTASANVSAAGTQHIFYALNAANGVTNVTVTITNWSDAFRSCELAEYSGVTGFDLQNHANGTSMFLRSGTSTTNFGNELIIGAGSVPTCGSCTPTPTPGFIIVAASAKSFQEYKVVTPIGNYSAGVNVPLSVPWLMNMATFH